jgi:hypothetical protein
MNKLEMVQIAMRELDGGSAADWTAFIERTYGEKINPTFIPVYLASIKDKAKLEAARKAARAAAAEHTAELAAKEAAAD